MEPLCLFLFVSSLPTLFFLKKSVKHTKKVWPKRMLYKLFTYKGIYIRLHVSRYALKYAGQYGIILHVHYSTVQIYKCRPTISPVHRRQHVITVRSYHDRVFELVRGTAG